MGAKELDEYIDERLSWMLLKICEDRSNGIEVGLIDSGLDIKDDDCDTVTTTATASTNNYMLIVYQVFPVISVNSH